MLSLTGVVDTTFAPLPLFRLHTPCLNTH
uniref:Uncharacterized protein n=1 Tax=Anguilla anguilla TaxID=7936 RepID=A0A0E9UU30_ANGAN